MTDPKPESEPTPQILLRQLRSVPLAAILSGALIALWVAYLVVAPTPVPPPPLQSQPAPTVAALPQLPDQMRLLVWRDVIDPEVLTAFEDESGITLDVERYTTFQELRTIASTGRLTHDMVITSGIDLSFLMERELLQSLDREQVQGYSGLNQIVLNRAAQYDVGNTYSLPILWGTTGLAFDRAQIMERIGRDPQSWSVLFEPELAQEVADCGIQVVRAPDSVFPVAFRYLNLPVDSVTVEDTDAAARLWERVRPFISRFVTADVVGGLARGEICLAMATSGDAYQAAVQSRALGAVRDIAYVLPEEGAAVWHALGAIPSGARYPGHAASLMSYLIRPEVAARLTNATGFVSAVSDAALYVKPEIKNDSAFNPDIDALPNTVFEVSPGEVGISLRDKFWQLINAPSESTPAPNEE